MGSDSKKYELRIPWYFSLPVVLLAGMAACHGVATLWILASNKELYTVLQVLNAQGYLTIPSPNIQYLLLQFKPAFFSALFFTVTLGVGVSLVFLAVGMLCARMKRRWTGFLFFFAIMAYFLLFVNLDGFVFYPTIFFVVVPLAAGGIMWRRCFLLSRQPQSGWLSRVFFILPVVVLGLLWSFQTSGEPFVDLRDTLLMTSKPGLAINDFYYDYTLYAARTFKPLAKRPMRTVHLEGNPHTPRNLSLKQKILNDHYLPVDDVQAGDIKITYDKNEVVLTGWHGEQLRVSLADFSNSPQRFFQQLSAKCDRLDNFRTTVFDGLMFGLPMGIYTFLFSIMSGLAAVRLGRDKGAGLTSAIWMVIGIVLYVQLAFLAHGGANGKSPQELLESSSAKERLVGLRKSMNGGFDILKHPAYESLLHSPRVAERYWLARVLAGNRDKEGFEDLVDLLKDPAPNVRCQAIWALSRRPWDKPIKYVEDMARHSNHYYVQLYAYNALRRLGWRQAA